MVLTVKFLEPIMQIVKKLFFLVLRQTAGC